MASQGFLIVIASVMFYYKYMLKPHIFSPERLTDETTVLLTTNHLGASIFGPSGQAFGDAGKDAQHLANASGRMVIGLDRPHTGDGENYNQPLSEAMVHQPELVASRWVKAAEPAIEKTGATSVELVGRSAGSNLLLEVALLELLPISGILTIDPVAMVRMPIWRGKLRFVKYQVMSAMQQDTDLDDGALSLPELGATYLNSDGPLTSLRRMMARQSLDIKQYQHSWASDQGLTAAALIATRMRATTASFAFAGYPLSTERSRLAPKVKALNELRRPKPNETRAESHFVEGTTHNSFNNPKIYGAEYIRFAQMANCERVRTSETL